jgi:hypothetical protein
MIALFDSVSSTLANAYGINKATGAGRIDMKRAPFRGDLQDQPVQEHL